MFERSFELMFLAFLHQFFSESHVKCIASALNASIDLNDFSMCAVFPHYSLAFVTECIYVGGFVIHRAIVINQTYLWCEIRGVSGPD